MIIAPLGCSDLDGIYDHIAADDPESAERFTHEILDHITKTAAIGHGGVSRETVSPGLRLIVHGRYCIYFRQNDTTMTVLRVLHSARDISKIDFSEGQTRQ